MADPVTLAVAVGIWSATVQLPTVPVAAAMLPTGKVLVWSSNAPMSFEVDIGHTPSNTLTALYDPATGAGVALWWCHGDRRGDWAGPQYDQSRHPRASLVEERDCRPDPPARWGT